MTRFTRWRPSRWHRAELSLFYFRDLLADCQLDGSSQKIPNADEVREANAVRRGLIAQALIDLRSSTASPRHRAMAIACDRPSENLGY